MPANVVKTEKDEEHWNEAKRLVREQYPKVSEDSDRFWRLVQGIYRRMKGGKGSRPTAKGGVFHRFISRFRKTRLPRDPEPRRALRLIRGNLPSGAVRLDADGRILIDAAHPVSKAQVAGGVGSGTREAIPQHVFLLPAERSFPVKVQSGGKWVYDVKLLGAAARRARMQGRAPLARQADAIRERLEAEEKAHVPGDR